MSDDDPFFALVDSAPFELEGAAYRYLVVTERPACGLSVLTPTQRDVALMVWKGRSNHDIASEHGSSVHTVANHLSEIFRRLGVSSRLELVEYVSRAS